VRLTIRSRLTGLYGLLLLTGGSVLVTAIYLLVRANLVGQLANAVTEVIPNAGRGAIRAIPLSGGASVDAVDIARASGNTVLAKLLTMSVLALAVLVVASVGVSWYAVGRVLRRVHRISATARRLSSDNLHERIALAGPRDELTELADTFDGMLDRLEAAFESQRRFIANASHELRTPLAIQRAVVQIGLAEERSDRVVRMREQLLDVNRRSERLIEGLLTLARSERGLAERETVALHELVALEVTRHRDDARARGIELHVELGECWVTGDPVLLTQLLGNLLSNAVRHNVDGGRVDVRTGLPGSVVISNTGHPLAEAELPALFEPFQRGGDRIESGEGAGLGLSIARSIVRAHHGTLRARPHPTGGLEMCVDLPT
jgi:signal transduction histidine kinase